MTDNPTANIDASTISYSLNSASVTSLLSGIPFNDDSLTIDATNFSDGDILTVTYSVNGSVTRLLDTTTINFIASDTTLIFSDTNTISEDSTTAITGSYDLQDGVDGTTDTLAII